MWLAFIGADDEHICSMIEKAQDEDVSVKIEVDCGNVRYPENTVEGFRSVREKFENSYIILFVRTDGSRIHIVINSDESLYGKDRNDFFEDREKIIERLPWAASVWNPYFTSTINIRPLESTTSHS